MSDMPDKTTPGWQCLLRGQEKFYADGGKDGLLGTYQAREVDAEIARLREREAYLESELRRVEDEYDVIVDNRDADIARLRRIIELLS